MGLSNLFVPWGMLLVDNIVLRAKTIEEANMRLQNWSLTHKEKGL